MPRLGFFPWEHWMLKSTGIFSSRWQTRLCSADLPFQVAWLAKKGIIVHVLPLFMCFQGDSNLPPEICFLQFCLGFKASSLPSLSIFVDERYHLKLCRFVNCSAPELHFSSRFSGSWPQKCRIASGPLLVLGGRLSLWLILLSDGKLG